MKKLMMSFVVLLLISSCNGIPNAKTETFKVWGNCGMCKKTIEKALAVDGIKADWNKTTKMITVTYDSKKYTIAQIHKMIAAAGYDTELERGNDVAYSKLHECCKYDRKP